MFVRRNIEIRPFRATHPDRVILTSLATADLAERFSLYPATFRMGRRVDRIDNYSMAHERVIFVDELHAADDVVRPRFVQCRAGAFDENILIAFDPLNDAIEDGVELRIALLTDPGTIALHQFAVAVDTFFSFVHGRSRDAGSVSEGVVQGAGRTGRRSLSC